MVNSGALATAGLVPGRSLDDRWQFVLDGLSAFAGHELTLDAETHRSAATLADGGVQPATGRQVVDRAMCRAVLEAMTTAGLYESSGDWLHDVGLPGKSGIGGGMVTVSPGKGGLRTFSPPLDAAGNSVRGQLVAGFLSQSLGLDLSASAPATSASPLPTR